MAAPPKLASPVRQARSGGSQAALPGCPAVKPCPAFVSGQGEGGGPAGTVLAVHSRGGRRGNEEAATGVPEEPAARLSQRATSTAGGVSPQYFSVRAAEDD